MFSEAEVDDDKNEEKDEEAEDVDTNKKKKFPEEPQGARRIFIRIIWPSCC